MTKAFKYILFAAALLSVLTACKDTFGKKLIPPSESVKELVQEGDNLLVFINTTGKARISEGVDVTSTLEDVIFTPTDPLGESRQFSLSLRMAQAESSASASFEVVEDRSSELLSELKEREGLRATFLPEGAYKLSPREITLERNKSTASSKVLLEVLNSQQLELGRDYILAIRPVMKEGYSLSSNDNERFILHVKRKSGTGEAEGAAVFLPMKGDDTLDATGVDKGRNRNNLYYSTSGDLLQNLKTFTIEGLIYVNAFKPEVERTDGTLAGISSVWGYEEYGSTVNFLLRFGDASLSTNQLQLIINNNKRIIPYKFKERRWYHIAFTSDGETYRFYINGREALSFDVPEDLQKPDKGTSLAGRYFRLGQSFNQWRGFDGMMSQVRIWRTARTPKQLRQNALDVVDFEAERAQMIAYWPMTAAAPDNKHIEDRSGNDLTLEVFRSGAASSIKPVVVIDKNIDIKL